MAEVSPKLAPAREPTSSAEVASYPPARRRGVYGEGDAASGGGRRVRGFRARAPLGTTRLGGRGYFLPFRLLCCGAAVWRVCRRRCNCAPSPLACAPSVVFGIAATACRAGRPWLPWPSRRRSARRSKPAWRARCSLAAWTRTRAWRAVCLLAPAAGAHARFQSPPLSLLLRRWRIRRATPRVSAPLAYSARRRRRLVADAMVWQSFPAGTAVVTQGASGEAVRA